LPVPLLEIIYQADKRPADPFDRVLYTNPAILCIEYSLARVVMEMGIEPDYLLGYSLGEFSAAVVGGAISLEDGIELVIEFARLLEDDMPHAGMLAVIDNIALTTEYPELFENCWVSGRNFDKNFVVSALVKDLDCLEMKLAQLGIAYQRLAVNHGFHTRLLDPIERQFKQLVSHIYINELTIPTISALTGKVIGELDEHHLWQVVRQPVAFDQTIDKLTGQGDYRFIDIGPSGSMATFVKYLLPKSSGCEHHEVINPFGKDILSLEKLKTAFDQTQV
jgi:acyl transferase domain-containing protein